MRQQAGEGLTACGSSYRSSIRRSWRQLKAALQAEHIANQALKVYPHKSPLRHSSLRATSGCSCRTIDRQHRRCIAEDMPVMTKLAFTLLLGSCLEASIMLLSFRGWILSVMVKHMLDLCNKGCTDAITCPNLAAVPICDSYYV